MAIENWQNAPLSEWMGDPVARRVMIRAAIRFEVAEAARQAGVDDDGEQEVAILDGLGVIDRAEALLSGRDFQSAMDLAISALQAVDVAAREWFELEFGANAGIGMTVQLVVDNADKSVMDTAHALWREGCDRVAIAGALMVVAEAMTGDPCPDAAIEILAPVAGRTEAEEAVMAALVVRGATR